MSVLGRLSLVIADYDGDYLEAFEKFLMVHYPQRFDIFSFSSFDRLSDFLSRTAKKDILAINTALYNGELQFRKAETVVFLTGDSGKPTPEGCPKVEKYQHAEKMIAELLRHYSARSTQENSVRGGSRTRIVCVYSPAGGTGKTSIAAGCSIMSAKRGLKSFYLNLEDVPSTASYFHDETEHNFSKVIYCLKEKGTNLGLKLEGLKNCDCNTGVHFFAPPDSVLEMEELMYEDIFSLVEGFRSSAVYDTVFIDMSCGLNKRNAAILSCADVILMVAVPGEAFSSKMRGIKAGMTILEHKYGVKPAGRVVTVMNRQNRKTGTGALNQNGSIRTLEFDDCSLQQSYGQQEGLLEQPAFTAGLNKLLEYLLTLDAAMGPEHIGGESIAG